MMPAARDEADFTRAELRDIDRHKYFMSLQRGHDVGFHAAAADWLHNVADTFRRRRQEHMLSLQREEISKHIWIESEKANCDRRREASLDWVHRYAAEWRKWYEGHFADK